MNRPFGYADLVELAEQAGIEPVYLEKDLILTTIIRAIATSLYGNELVLKGGQALRHIYGGPRLSKDVDYVAKKRMEFSDLISALSIKQFRMKLPDAPVDRTGRGFRINPISYRGLLGQPDNIEIEVSFRCGHDSIEGTRQIG